MEHKEHRTKEGFLYSVEPPTKFLTFGTWIYLVPQYKPENMLILGFAGGTVAGLVRLLYGDLPITAVDIEPCEAKYGVNFIQADAREYIETAPNFDCILVDLYVDGKEPDFVYTREFAQEVENRCRYLVLSTHRYEAPDAYKMDRVYGIQSGGNYIHYYKQKGILNDITPAV